MSSIYGNSTQIGGTVRQEQSQTRDLNGNGIDFFAENATRLAWSESQ